MVVIALISQKGGVGKSTLAQALAVEGSQQKLRVLLADYDPQQKTSCEWAKRRATKSKYLTVQGFNTFAEITQQEKAYDLIVIDGPARTSQGTLEIAKQADLVIQPTGPSLADLKPSVLEFHSLVKAGVDKAKLVFVLNHLSTVNEEAAAREYLAGAGYQVLTTGLKEKASYRAVQNEGLSIGEVNYETLRRKVKELVKEIVGRVS